jgi:hypothetical protein
MQAVGGYTSPCTVRSHNDLKVRFSATLGEEPEVEMTWIMLISGTSAPEQTPRRLHYHPFEVHFPVAMV